MKKEMKESISQYVELYDAIQEKTGNDEVTAVILQEIGKDTRMSKMALAAMAMVLLLKSRKII